MRTTRELAIERVKEYRSMGAPAGYEEIAVDGWERCLRAEARVAALEGLLRRFVVATEVHDKYEPHSCPGCSNLISEARTLLESAWRLNR